MGSNQNISLLLDGREKGGVIETINESIDSVKVENLAVGDFWICKNFAENEEASNSNNENQEDVELDPNTVISKGIELLVVLERKTWNDFVSSLMSRHIYNQRRRLLECKGAVTGFVIEGKRNKRVGYKKSERRQVEKFLLHSQLRDGLRVFYTDDIEDTTELIKHFMKKLGDPKFLSNKNNGMKYEDCVKLDKKSDLTVESCYLSQLTQIKGVSTNVARLISTKYKSMAHLCVRIYQNKKKVISRISDLKTVSDTGKKRRIGAVLATRIVNFLIGKSQ